MVYGIRWWRSSVEALVSRWRPAARPFTTAHRIRRLADGLPEGTLHFGRRAVSIDQDPGSAEVRFADGTAASADLVIGADGSRSVVRDLV